MFLAGYSSDVSTNENVKKNPKNDSSKIRKFTNEIWQFGENEPCISKSLDPNF